MGCPARCTALAQPRSGFDHGNSGIGRNEARGDRLAFSRPRDDGRGPVLDSQQFELHAAGPAEVRGGQRPQIEIHPCLARGHAKEFPGLLGENSLAGHA